MSNFPFSLDDDSTLPRIDDNITELGGDAINALRSAMFAVEQNIGIGANGSQSSIAQRLNTSLNSDGTIIPSALTGIGLVSLPITNSQISPTAGIQESKLNLTYSTGNLFTLYTNLKSSIDVLNGFLSLTGIKLEPHIDGTNFNHLLSAIHVDPTVQMLKTIPQVLPAVGTSVGNRNTTNADTLIKDISDDLIIHEKANGSANVMAASGGTVPPLNYAHMSSGLYLDPSNFSTIPQTNNTVQKFAEYVDNSSLLLIGNRVQNLFSNGVSKTARATSLVSDGYGSPLVPPTSASASLLGVPPSSIFGTSPVDDINHGDDVILFNPTTQQLNTFNFDAQFGQVKPGDLLTINYGNGLTAQFSIDSVKSIINGNSRTYAVRINTKNLFSSSNASARIDRPLFNTNKYGVLAVARSSNSSISALDSLIVAAPRSAIALGNGFNPSEFDSVHYSLYLSIFPNGNPTNFMNLPAIDVTGNRGITPGQYTLDSIIDNINLAFRQAGYNYRFIAFQYNGQFGIMLADSYDNVAFSIISGSVDGYGNYTSSSLSSYPNNVVDNFNLIDPLGLGLSGANLASPPPAVSYTTSNSAFFAPTLIFYPLKRNYFYANGVEREILKSDPNFINQIVDGYGDGYWPATVLGSPYTTTFANRVEVTYQINLDLATSGLKIGKTLVVQPSLLVSDPKYNFRDYGRFIIKNITFSGCDTANPQTNITVYDGVYGTGVSPSATTTNIPVNIYFSDDSVAFDIENVSDASNSSPYKRFFEVYVDQFGHTFTHERARFLSVGSDISNINFVKVSPKLKGFITQIFTGEIGAALQLTIGSYDSTTGNFIGQLGTGPITTGKKGDVVRFYDISNIDYIDFEFDKTASIGSFTNKTITIQLYPSLELDQESMLIAACQVNDTTGAVSNLKDERQFGNTSESNLTLSALDYIAAPTKLITENGIIKGFDCLTSSPISSNSVSFDGGTAIVNGKIININPSKIQIPSVVEAVNGSITSTVNVITWFVCVNDKSELELIASTDYDPFGSFASQYTSVSVDHNRLFYVLNKNATVNPYQVRATYFGDLVLNKKDVTPIASIVATVTNTGTSFNVSSGTINDIRRYISGGYSGLSEPLTLGVEASFRTIQSLINYLNLLNNFYSASVSQSNPISNHVIIKGHNLITSTVSISSVYNEIFFDGQGAGAFDVFTATGFEIGSNIHFEKIAFNYVYDPVAYSAVGFSVLDLINTGKGLIHITAGLFKNNISFNKNHFNWFPSLIGIAGAPATSIAINRYSFINLEMAGPTAGAPPTIFENINISDNTFTDNTLVAFGSNIDSKRAAISFVSLSTTLNTLGGGLKLVGVNIENNLCDKDQLIAIVPTIQSNNINAAFNTTSCNISKNICGAISVFTQFDIPIDSNNTTNYFNLIADKNNSITISNNTTKYITSTDQTGFDLPSRNPTININTGAINILNNTASWIKIHLNVVSSSPATLPCNINENNLFAYDINFRLAYMGGSGSPTNNPIQTVLNGGSLSTVSVINGNYINTGSYNTGLGVATFTYDNGIATAHDATISNNSIFNLSANAIGIILNSSSVSVHSDICYNKFYRLGTIWQAYVYLGFSGNHTVAFNFFDQITPDGDITHTENQVTGSVDLSNIHDNRNQVVNVPISLVDGQKYFSRTGVPAASSTGPAASSQVLISDFGTPGGGDLASASNIDIFKYRDAFSPTSSYTGVVEFALSTATSLNYRNISFTIPLSSYIPAGAKILQLQVGVWLQYQGAGALDTSLNTNNAITLSLFRTTDALTTTAVKIITDVKGNIAPSFPNAFSGTDFSNASISPTTYTVLIYSASSSGSGYRVVTPGTAQGATQLLTVNETTGYTVGNGYRINAQVDLNFIRTSAGTIPTDQIIFYFSPLLVSYTW